MPLNAKGETIKSAMEKQYGEKKGTSVFYASKAAGTISGVDAVVAKLDAACSIMADAAIPRMPIPDHPYHHKTDAELTYILRDAGQAARNMRGMDDRAEAKYLDQVNDASTILYWRRQGGARLDSAERADADRSTNHLRNQLSDYQRDYDRAVAAKKPLETIEYLERQIKEAKARLARGDSLTAKLDAAAEKIGSMARQGRADADDKWSVEVHGYAVTTWDPYNTEAEARRAFNKWTKDPKVTRAYLLAPGQINPTAEHIGRSR